MNWLEIAEALQKAPGPSKELSEAIHVLLGYELHYAGTPAYTASLDAITALIERELPGWMVRIQWCSVSAEAWVAPDLNDPRCDSALRANEARWHDYYERNEVEIRPGSRNAAIRALCAAFARAMHERGAK